jgi:hypothetical protein
MQDEQTEIVIRTDADWAGCRRSRKSTSGGNICIGGHCIKVWAKTQAVIAKSSAESELYGVVRGACEGLGMKSLCADLGSDVGIRLELDATAAKGILDRQGLAKVRHIDVNCLWLQEQCAKKMVPLVKILGDINTADLMTKHLVGPVMLKHVNNLNLELRAGRSEQAAKLHSMSTVAPLQNHDQPLSRNLPGGDYWAERGENGRWVRAHVTPRSSMFYPEEAPRGPGRKTRLRPTRKVQGTYASGLRFKKESDWTRDNEDDEFNESWTGRTIFIVDKHHSSDHGTDQRRQRVESSNNRRVSWADLSD